MRYEHYKMARKCGWSHSDIIIPPPPAVDKLGFAELCVDCSLSTALARNSLRATPIPDYTLVAMERSLERPDPTQHHWERQSALVKSDEEETEFTKRGR